MDRDEQIRAAALQAAATYYVSDQVYGRNPDHPEDPVVSLAHRFEAYIRHGEVYADA